MKNPENLDDVSQPPLPTRPISVSLKPAFRQILRRYSKLTRQRETDVLRICFEAIIGLIAEIGEERIPSFVLMVRSEEQRQMHQQPVPSDANDHACAIHDRLAQVDITEIPVITQDRGLFLSQRVVLVKDLFHRLGLDGIGVADRYSESTSFVEVRPPQRAAEEDWKVSDPAIEPAPRYNADMRTRLRAILLAAFPNHDDFCDPGTDPKRADWKIV